VKTEVLRGALKGVLALARCFDGQQILEWLATVLLTRPTFPIGKRDAQPILSGALRFLNAPIPVRLMLLGREQADSWYRRCKLKACQSVAGG